MGKIPRNLIFFEEINLFDFLKFYLLSWGYHGSSLGPQVTVSVHKNHTAESRRCLAGIWSMDIHLLPKENLALLLSYPLWNIYAQKLAYIPK